MRALAACRAFRIGSAPRRTVVPMRVRRFIADALLIAFVVALAVLTLAQVRFNAAAGPHGHAPHDPAVAARSAGR